MVIQDAGKLIILSVIVFGLMVGLLLGRFDDPTAAWAALTGIIGYLIGNGAAAVRKQSPSPVVVGRVESDEVLTVSGSYPATKTSNGERDEQAQ